MKKEIYLFMFFMVLVLVVGSFVSAGFLDNFYAKITGKDVSGTASLNVTIGNAAPTVSFVAVIPAITPNENGVNYTSFIVNVTDSDGVDNIDDNSVEARFELSGEITRVNTSCILLADIDANSANYSCTVGMYYFDKNDASWTVNVTALDSNSARGINASTTVQFSLLTSMVTGGALAWATLGLASTNTGADNNPIIVNNTGNDIDLRINVTAFDLEGLTTSGQFIGAENISIENITAGCTGPFSVKMINGTNPSTDRTNITSAILQRGNNSLSNSNATSGQEELFFCITAVNSDLSSQDYSSDSYGSWSILIIT